MDDEIERKAHRVTAGCARARQRMMPMVGFSASSRLARLPRSRLHSGKV
jgi:hypothetical protein